MKQSNPNKTIGTNKDHGTHHNKIIKPNDQFNQEEIEAKIGRLWKTVIIVDEKIIWL